MDRPSPDERVIVITGATGVLGRAAASAFAAEGARLGLVGRDAGRLQALASDLGLDSDRRVSAVADLRDEAAASAAITMVRERFGRVDVLLHLVGGWVGGTALTETDPTVLTSMLGQHVWSTFNVARTVVPGMVQSGWGRIIAVSSTATLTPGPNVAAYLAAKAAQEALLRSLAREVASRGVTVNVLAVKVIDADHERERAPAGKNAGWTTPNEIVATMRYLCSDDAAAINGTRIPLDGRA